MAETDEDIPETEAGDSTLGLGASPSRISNPRISHEFARALVWSTTIGALALAVYLAQPLLVIFGAMVFATLIDGGARLIGKALPIARGWRVAMVLVLTVAFFAWLVYFAGSTISRDAAQFPALIQEQLGRLLEWAQAQGFDINRTELSKYANSLTTGISTVTRALGGIVGGITTIILILIIGVYLSLEPMLYERGVAWILPENRRDSFYETVARMAYTMRRLMAGRLVGMVVEAVFTYIMLAFVGPLVGIGAVPMAGLLAILTGLLAFIPNLGAIISGILMALVGFSGGADMGLYTIAVYFLVQNFDGYIVIPMIARKTVDLAPALVLAMQLVMGILFGVLGLFLADPLLAMIKVALERRAEIVGQSDEKKSRAQSANGA